MPETPAAWAHRLSRRALFRTGASTVLGATALGMLPGATHAASRPIPATGQAAVPGTQDAATLFRELDAKI